MILKSIVDSIIMYYKHVCMYAAKYDSIRKYSSGSIRSKMSSRIGIHFFIRIDCIILASSSDLIPDSDPRMRCVFILFL